MRADERRMGDSWVVLVIFQFTVRFRFAVHASPAAECPGVGVAARPVVARALRYVAICLVGGNRSNFLRVST